MTIDAQHLLDALPGAVFTAGVVWGTLRAQLAYMKREIQSARAAVERAHRRIDQHLEKHA